MSELSNNVPAVHLGEGDTVKDGLASQVRDVLTLPGEHFIYI